MLNRQIVSHNEWTAARKDLLRKEKEFTRLRDELTAQRRQLPWIRIEKDYSFEGPDGRESLAHLFGSCSQLIVYHFMFDPEWSEGCKSCSLVADHYNPVIVHLSHRDVSMVTVSRAPLEKLQAFRKRMGWTFKWVSSHRSDFNRDFNVTFTAEELQQKTANYNFEFKPFPMKEAPGISVFVKDDAGQIYHSYSSYARGLETFLGIYHFLDIVPKGRDEDADAYPMQWLRHHDSYGAEDPFEYLVSKPA